MTTKVPAELSSTPSISDSGNATAITIDSSEDVTVNNGTLTSSGANGVGNQGFHITDTGYSKTHKLFGDNSLHIQADSGQSILMKPNASEIARFTSDGLTFNGDTAAANALDDYEEGTFTPNLRFGSTDNATTYDRTGQYTKIGNTVYVTIQLGFPNGVTTSDGGIAQISNLPFTSISGARHIGPLSPYGMSGFGNRPVCRVGGGSDILYLNDDHAGNFYVASDFATSAEMFMSITYQGA